MKERWIKRFMCLFLAFAVLSASGCGIHNTGGDDSSEKMQKDKEKQDIVMGRYVEEEIDQSKDFEVISGMKKFSDGKLVVTDRQKGLWVSTDGGVVWESENRQWLEDKLHHAYIMDVQIMADGTLGVIYDNYEEESAEDEKLFNLSPECALVKEDGTVIPVVLSLSEEDRYADHIWMSDTGRIFVTTLGDNIYEVKEEGSSELFLTVESRPGFLQFHENLMIIDGYDYMAPLLYDLEKEEYVKDEVLAEFVGNNYGNRGFNGDSWYDLYFFSDEDGVLYMAGKKGLHRHVIGEAKVEQLIDGNLSRLGSPQYGIKSMVSLGEEKFLAVFNSGRLVRFTFDPDVKAVPDERLKVYSLEESYSIRVAISIYQIAHPDVFVEYEIGMEEGNGITREDALKNLNTRIMAGEGPDLLMLDGLPMDSYMEKGLLVDLSSMLGDFTGKESLFENLFQALKKNGNIYAVPGEVSLPVMLGREKYVSGMENLTSIAEAVEQMRKDNPEKDILGICSEKGIMKVFSVISEPSWKTDKGEINRDMIEEFLTQIKRIYDAQMDGISEKSVKRYQAESDYYVREYGEDWLYDLGFYGHMTLDYVGGYVQFMIGKTSYPYGYCDITSAARTKGFEDTLLKPGAGQSCQIFIPQTILGISAVSSQKELAEDFLKMFLGKEVQYALGGFPVNRAAFDELFIPEEKYLGPNNQYGAMAMIDEDGVEVQMDVFFPEEDEIERLKEWMALADTPYIPDLVLEKTVFEEGTEFIQGNQSLEEALDAIWKQLAIYMSE